MSTPVELLQTLDADAELAQAFEDNPEAVMKALAYFNSVIREYDK